MSTTIPPKAATTATTTAATRPSNLRHDFQIVAKQNEPQRNSFTFRNGWRENIFDIQTAQRPITPHLAIDLQPIPCGFGSAGAQNDVVESKLSDLPPALKESGKGVLLIGTPNDYSLGEIYALSNFSQTLPEGSFVVIAKTISSPSPSAQCWATRTTGAKCNYNYEGYAVPDVISFIRQEILSPNK